MKANPAYPEALLLALRSRGAAHEVGEIESFLKAMVKPYVPVVPESGRRLSAAACAEKQANWGDGIHQSQLLVNTNLNSQHSKIK